MTTAHGTGAQTLRGQVFPAAGTLAARALATQRTARSDDNANQAPVDWQPGLGPTVAIPLTSGSEPLGVLTIARSFGAHPFTDADLEMAFAFASQASVAIEVVQAREARRRDDTSQDRARIARDLHDHVIQRLFGAGLSLQAVSTTVESEPALAIEAQIDAIDAAIADIRTVIFALGASERQDDKSTRDRLLDVVAEASAGLPSTPRIVFSGPIDALVQPLLAEELVAVLRECLANVVRHAHALTVEVFVTIADGIVTLTVTDDGIGVSPDAPLSGLANIVERAALRGGTCTIGAHSPQGTRIDWSVPADEDPDEEAA